MPRKNPAHVVVVGAGAAGLMAASRAGARRQAGNDPRSARPHWRTHLSAAGGGIRVPGGRRRRVRPWRGPGDARADARGRIVAGAAPRHAMERPFRRAAAGRAAASACRPVLPGPGRGDGRPAGRGVSGRRISRRRNTTSCGAGSREPSRDTTPPIRTASAPWRCARNGWRATTASTGASGKATAR